MNTTATSYSSGCSSWVTPTVSRRGSTESVLSIQGKETDFVHDTSDTETYDSDARDVEYEPVTESEEEAPITTDSSGLSDDEIITTKVIEVSVRDDGELAFADGEAGDSDDSDSEIDLYDYWRCAQCRTTNNNPLYRYCQKCFKVRKNFFPPRPKRKCKRTKPETDINDKVTHLTDLVDSGVDSAFTSQEFSQHSVVSVTGVADGTKPPSTASSTRKDDSNDTDASCSQPPSRIRKRRAGSVDRSAGSVDRSAGSVDRSAKLSKVAQSDSDSSVESACSATVQSALKVCPLVKTVSDPSLTIESDPKIKLTKKAIANSLKEKLEATKDDLCIVCLTEPKSGVFVHGRVAHICCCYKCSLKVWATAKRCPICNSKVSNVLKAVVM